MSDELICANTTCGAALPADAKFCSQCGTPVAAAAGPGPPEPVRGRPDLDAVFAHLRSGEQRPATILMTDISGFTTLGERADPEWLYDMINEVFEELVDCLVAHGAHIDKYMGDEIMALFGVPIALEQSGARALRAALALRERLAELNREGRFGDTRLELHTAVNSGPVMVGPVGHRRHADYTVIGDAVNVTKRLEDEAPAGEIYVSRAAHDSVGSEFEFERVGLLRLSGRKQEVEAFRLLRAAPSTAAMSHGADVALLGREAELQALIEASQAASEGEQVAVYLVGPAGIGKSRIAREWAVSPGALSFRTLECSCHGFGRHFPLLALVELVTQLVGLRLEGWPARVTGDIEAALSRVALTESERAPLQGLLHAFAGALAESEGEWREELAPAFRALLAAVAHDGPICIVLEDIQWLDEPTANVLAEALDHRGEWPLLIVVSSREPVDQPFPTVLQPTTVVLAALPLGVMSRLVAAWAEPDVLPGSTIEAIADRAQGHPYFARELVVSLRGAAPSGGPAAGLPHTLQELFLAQLDWLPAELRRLVQAASVLGEPMSPRVLDAAMAAETPLSDELLSSARDADLLRPGPGPEQHVFGRRLLFEAAYATIPPNRRKDLHARIAAYIIENRSDLGPAAVHTAAHHAYLGLADERAVALLLESSDRYHLSYANRGAIRDAIRATEVIGSLADPTTHSEARIEALWLLSQSYQVLGDLDQAEGALAEAEMLADDCPNRELVARVALAAATLRFSQGDLVEAERQFGKAREVWGELNDPTRVCHAALGMGMCANAADERARALALFEQAAAVEGAALWARGAALNNAGVVLLQEGRYTEADTRLCQGLEANRDGEDRRGTAHSKASLGELYYRMARMAEAEAILREALAESEEIEDLQCRTVAAAYLARALAAEGSLGSARVALDQVPGDLPEDPELRAVRDLAVLDVGMVAASRVAHAEGKRRERPAWPPGGNACGQSPVCLNARVEGFCLLLEEARSVGDTRGAETLSMELRKWADTASDRHLRRYAGWLSVAQGPPLGSTDELTVYDVRPWHAGRHPDSE